MSLALTPVTLPSGELQLFVGGLTSGGVSLWQTGSDLAVWTAPTPACTNENGLPQVWGVLTVSPGTLNTRFKQSGSSSWTTGEPFNPQPAITPGHPINAIAAGKSIPGRIQLFAALPNPAAGQASLMTTWQVNANEQSFYAWSAMDGAPVLGENNPVIGATNVPDGRLQLWALSSSNQLQTCWKSGREENAPWTAWTPVSSQPGTIFSIAGGVRPDGHLELWCVAEGGLLINATQESSPSATGLSWADVNANLPAGVTRVYSVAVANLSGSRLQVFILAPDAQANGATVLYTCWTTASSVYTSWVKVSLAT